MWQKTATILEWSNFRYQRGRRSLDFHCEPKLGFPLLVDPEVKVGLDQYNFLW